MNVINCDTNAALGGLRVPAGAFDWPFHGGLSVLTSTGSSNFVSLGMSDTLVIYPGGCSVADGPDVVLFLVAGLGLSMLGFGTLAFARWLTRKLTMLGHVEER